MIYANKKLFSTRMILYYLLATGIWAGRLESPVEHLRVKYDGNDDSVYHRGSKPHQLIAREPWNGIGPYFDFGHIVCRFE